MILSQTEAMALTYAIEAVVAAMIAFPLRLTPWACAAAAIAGTTVTHPILWAVFASAQAALGPIATPVLEVGVIAAEILAYRALATSRWDDAALLSLLANAASWGTGEVIYALS